MSRNCLTNAILLSFFINLMHRFEQLGYLVIAARSEYLAPASAPYQLALFEVGAAAGAKEVEKQSISYEYAKNYLFADTYQDAQHALMTYLIESLNTPLIGSRNRSHIGGNTSCSSLGGYEFCRKLTWPEAPS